MDTLILAWAGPTTVAAEGSVAGLVTFVSIALGASFLCSVLEAVLLSTTASHVELQIQKKRRSGQVMRRLMSHENIDRSIAAILTLNTIAHTVGAAGAGAQAAAIFGSQYIGLIGAVLTVLILVVSEIIPKTIGAVYWKGLNGFAAYTTLALVRILFPIVWACQRLTDVLKPKTNDPVVTRSELEIMARLGQKEGTIEPGESRVVQNLLRLDQVLVKEILTPRTVLFALEDSRTVQDVFENETVTFSRIPIYGKSRDEIDRFVLRFDLLTALASDQGERTLSEFERPLQTVPANCSVAQLLNEFVAKQTHMMIVVDEFGGTAGLVTLEDAIESLLGAEITDESDLVADLRELAKQRAQKRGKLIEVVAESEEKVRKGSPTSPNPPTAGETQKDS